MLLALWLVIVSGVHMTAAPAGAKDAPASDGNQTPVEADVVHYRYKVIESYPHDRQAFTQGLVYENGLVYEGTGLRGQCAIVAWDLKTGKIIRRLRLPERYFGEGIAILGDRLIQLTWKSNTGFVYKRDTFTLIGQFDYPTQGWGITHDGKRLILSDGTAILRFLDPNTYAQTGRLEVRDRGRLVRGINELEFIPAAQASGGPEAPEDGDQACPEPAEQDGRDAETPRAEDATGSIYANVWPTSRIVIIDPKTGRVTGWLNLTGLYPPADESRANDVLNGIAYLPESRRLLVTGKFWPKLYEIELSPRPAGERR